MTKTWVGIQIGAISFIDEGVEQVLEILREETENALALLGCRSPAEVTAGHIKPG